MSETAHERAALESLYERAVWQIDALDRWAVVRSRYGNGWFACDPERMGDHDAEFPTHAEAIAHATVRAGGDSSWKH